MDAVKLFGCLRSFASRVIGYGFGVLIKVFYSVPLIPDAASWFDELDRFSPEPFMARRRNQPITPRREIFK